MIEKLIPKQDRKFSDVKELQDSTLPLVMYGAGSYAEDVARFLIKHGISLSGCFIDDTYYKPDEYLMNKIEVSSAKTIEERFGSYNVVIGFSDYKRARKNLGGLHNTNAIYFIDAPNQFGFIDYEYIKAHQEQFEQTYDLLEDDVSKEIFIAFLNAKMSGDPSPLYQYAEFNQYFNTLVRLTDHESFVDCGAFDGDTIQAFLSATNAKYTNIIALEPDTNNFENLSRNVLQHPNIELYNKACWSSSGKLLFSSEANVASLVASGGSLVEVEKIDTIADGRKITFIKMDIEGAELEALKGAHETISAHAPKLAICAYHRPEDLITLPQYIKMINDEYKFYLRHHQYMSWEMVLYALPPGDAS